MHANVYLQGWGSLRLEIEDLEIEDFEAEVVAGKVFTRINRGEGPGFMGFGDVDHNSGKLPLSKIRLRWLQEDILLYQGRVDRDSVCLYEFLNWYYGVLRSYPCPEDLSGYLDRVVRTYGDPLDGPQTSFSWDNLADQA